MYTDLASIYERAGLIKGKRGSITQLNILTMPGEDITHPIPDLTGYITEGQIYLSRDLSNKGIYPPINPLGSLSRLMNTEIGKDKTREDHRGVADQLYGSYAKTLEARNLSSIVGMEALSEGDKQYLRFGEGFERRFLSQSYTERRDIGQTLDLGWDLLSEFDKSELTRIKSDLVEKYYKSDSMAQVNPTRINLINTRKGKVLARKGHDLLKRKREVLVIEFLKLSRNLQTSGHSVRERITPGPYEHLRMPPHSWATSSLIPYRIM